MIRVVLGSTKLFSNAPTESTWLPQQDVAVVGPIKTAYGFANR